MSVERFHLGAGSLYAEHVADDGIGDEWNARGERMCLVGARLDATVRWVQVPDELGGRRANVVGSIALACPCGGDHDSLALVLDLDELCVAECAPTRRFLWWRR
jgi:hypothetical protein